MATIAPKISFNPGISSEHITGLVRSTLESICLAAAVEEIWITSAFRDATGQAKAMYDNLAAGQPAQGSAAQQKVTAVYSKMVGDGQTDSGKIKDAMAKKISEIGPEKVSKHSKSPLFVVVVDISKNKMPEAKRQAFVDAVRAKVGLWVVGFGHPYARQGMEFYDPVFHIEMLTELSQSGAIELAERRRATA